MELQRILQPLYLLIIVVFMSSCGQSNSAESAEMIENGESIAANKTENCFISYRERPCDLITIQQLAGILGIGEDQISSRDNSQILQSSPELIACLFETPGSSNQGTISVGQLQKVDPDVFKSKYNNEYYSTGGREAKYLDDSKGDAAVVLYNSGNTILTVLKNGETFIVQIYGNKKTNEENLETAKKVAGIVLEKCQ